MFLAEDIQYKLFLYKVLPTGDTIWGKSPDIALKMSYIEAMCIYYNVQRKIQLLKIE